MINIRDNYLQICSVYLKDVWAKSFIRYIRSEKKGSKAVHKFASKGNGICEQS